MRRLLLWCSLASYTSADFERVDESDSERSEWAAEFRKVIANSTESGVQIASLMSLLASSLSNGIPLPPYLEMPQPFSYVKRLNELDNDIISIRHMAEPEYSAFAVMQVVTQCVNTDIRKLTECVFLGRRE
jgi:hypothetical protein